MRPRLLDKLTQVRNEVFIVGEKKGKSFSLLLLPRPIGKQNAPSLPFCIIVTMA